MAASVIELCNPELFTVRATTRSRAALDSLARLGIHGAPVVSDDGRAVGVVTVGDLVGDLGNGYVADRMSEPAVAVDAESPIALAAQRLADHCVHHLVVTKAGETVGFLSALDVIRGMLGRPPRHPDALPHVIDELGIKWSDAAELDLRNVLQTPTEPGLFVLIHGGAFREERAVWAEETNDVRSRLEHLLADPNRRPSKLRPWFDWGRLRFRAATADEDARRDALRQLGSIVDVGPEPAADLASRRTYGVEGDD